MFDRGLISAEDDGTILIARDTPARSIVDRLVVPGRRLLLPADPHLRPAATFLKWHRDHRFKG
jgi:putative restriction endonuclease